ncbi:GTPase IMAP family member 4-like [Lissotriton helveticus]
MATETPELRMVLVGRLAAGKSASGNSILGQKVFKSGTSSNAVTLECKDGTCNRDGRKIVVVDTPGLFDPVILNSEMARELAKSVVKSAPGPHAFVLVIEAGRFTPEEAEAVRDIQTLFGEEASRFTLVLFTRMDGLQAAGVTLEEHIRGADPKLREVLEGCGGRYLGFNKRASWEEREKQAEALITKIQEMIEENGGSHYTTEMFQRAEEEIQAREKEIREERQRSGQSDEKLPPPREEAKKSFLAFILPMLKRDGDLPSLNAIASALSGLFQ